MSSLLHMPVVPPPPAGADRDAHYAAVAAATTVVAAPVANAGLEINVSNAAYGGLFALMGGFATFVPPGGTLPTEGQEPSPGEGTVVIQTAPADVVAAKKKLPPGVPAPHRVLYLNVRQDTFLAAVDALVRALPQGELERAWDQPSSPVSRKVLEDYYLERVGKGTWAVFVATGAPLGEAGYRLPGAPATGSQVTLRLQDRAGTDLSPVLHLRALPSLNAKRWKGHPLAAAVANVVVPVDIHLKFEVWQSGDTYLPLPAGVRVDLVDYDPESPNDVLATAATDAQGRVHFSIPDLGAVDERQPDLFFRVRTGGMRHAGHTLPDEWETKGWRATDGSPGYYPDFAGTRLGDAGTPLVFRIGLDFHARLTFRHEAVDEAIKGATLSATKGSARATLVGGADARLLGMTLRVQGEDATYRVANISGSILTLDRPYQGATGHGKAFTVSAQAPKGVPVTLATAPLPPPASPDRGGTLLGNFLTDVKGEVHGITFDVSPGQHLFFLVEFEAEDPAVGLPRAEVVPAVFEQLLWVTSWVDADTVVLSSVDRTSQGSPAQPVVLRASQGGRDAALFILKCVREMHITLKNLSGGLWGGLGQDLTVHLFAPDRSFSWPVGSIFLSGEDHWDRGVIMHEISHQVMWRELGDTTAGIVYEEALGDLSVWHSDDLLYTRRLALVEGWGGFWQEVFAWNGRTPPMAGFADSTLFFTPSSKTVTSNFTWSRWVNGSIHEESSNTWYRIVGPAEGGKTSTFELDRAYQGTGGSGKKTWVHSRVEDKNQGIERALFPLPALAIDGDGEKVEGDYGNGMWMIYQRHITRRADPRIPESVDGDTAAVASWTIDPGVVGRFRSMLWEPFRDLAAVESPDTRKMFENIRTRNPARWHELHRELQLFNMMPAVPTLWSITPAAGPAAGGQAVTVVGTNFTAGAEVRIGGNLATNVAVSSTTALTADTPPGAAGSVADVEVRTLSGTVKLAGGYTYT